ncbi:MAG: hypothetical protein EOO20_18300 [Chryseobacterium sp.]|nr:MAG: hypothetical protein EOO20_18300 [Chryseobacterium sp.]
MDEGVEIVDGTCPWESEEIQNDQFVYRQIPVMKRQGTRPRMYPNEGCFELRGNEESLSFNLQDKITPHQNYILIGLSDNGNGGLNDYTAYKIFKFPVNFLVGLPKYEAILHTPVYEGSPSPVGKPNNPSHVSLLCGNFDDGTRVLMSDYCLEDFDNAAIEFKVGLLKKEIDELRARANDTPYHKEWVFEAPLNIG